MYYILHITYYILHIIYYILYSIYFIFYILYFMLYIIYYISYIIYYLLCIDYYIVYTVLSYVILHYITWHYIILYYFLLLYNIIYIYMYLRTLIELGWITLDCANLLFPPPRSPWKSRLYLKWSQGRRNLFTHFCTFLQAGFWAVRMKSRPCSK